VAHRSITPAVSIPTSHTLRFFFVFFAGAFFLVPVLDRDVHPPCLLSVVVPLLVGQNDFYQRESPPLWGFRLSQSTVASISPVVAVKMMFYIHFFRNVVLSCGPLSPSFPLPNHPCKPDLVTLVGFPLRRIARSVRSRHFPKFLKPIQYHGGENDLTCFQNAWSLHFSVGE